MGQVLAISIVPTYGEHYRFYGHKKTVIPQRPTVFPATVTTTDIPFLTKMQKRVKPQYGNCPPAKINLQNMIVPAR
jgi:hypothetical protein